MPSRNEIVRDSLIHSKDASHYKLSVKGESPRCSETLKYREHALIGISPFNSRFSPSYVEGLLLWAHREFKSVDVLLPDTHHAGLLLLASGIAPEKAAQKARKELNRHIRTIKKVLEKLDLCSAATRILKFSDFFDHPKYLQLRNQVEAAYDQCDSFRAACEEMSSQAISGRVKAVRRQSDPAGSGTRIDVAIPYLFAELPFYLNSPSFTMTPTSTFLYHKTWPIGIGLREGRFPLAIDDNQAHGTVLLN